jgi:hypothetical protein
MRIVNHFTTGVETINVNEKDKKVIVENQSYNHKGKTNIHTIVYEFGEIPPRIWKDIKNRKNHSE